MMMIDLILSKNSPNENDKSRNLRLFSTYKHQNTLLPSSNFPIEIIEITQSTGDTKIEYSLQKVFFFLKFCYESNRYTY